MTTVLFACVHNAGRSQIAAALFNTLADPNVARAISAGTQPGAHVHPEVVQVMREIGLDLSGTKPTLLADALANGAQTLVTMGCGETCPFVQGAERIEWNIPDPKEQSLERVRDIRDEIRGRVEELIATRGWKRQAK